MAKHLKLTIKNTQIAQAVNLGGIKEKLAKKKEAEEVATEADQPSTSQTAAKIEKQDTDEALKAKEDAPRVRARSKSVFAEPSADAHLTKEAEAESTIAEAGEELQPSEDEESIADKKSKIIPKKKTSEELRKEIFGDDVEQQLKQPVIDEKKIFHDEPKAQASHKESQLEATPKVELPKTAAPAAPAAKQEPSFPKIPVPKRAEQQAPMIVKSVEQKHPSSITAAAPAPERVKLGPTGRHIKDYLPPPPKKVEPPAEAPRRSYPQQRGTAPASATDKKPEQRIALPPTEEELANAAKNKAKKFKEGEEAADIARKSVKAPPAKEYRDIKPGRRDGPSKSFDARDRQGLGETEEEQRWRKKRAAKGRHQQEDITIRPTSLKIRVPISIKDLAAEMKLKSSQLISKLFLKGVIVTLNDLVEDETTIQLLGHDFGCEISIDTSEEQRIRITDKTIKEEINTSQEEQWQHRPPVVAFMGHVDHGKTSLIDAIRKTNRASGEAGAITQHIGAFRCKTAVGDICILDTPGHEAFSAMRARGADVTDIVVLVVAGDEGIRQQTIEAIQHARAANVTMVVAINKSDKPNFNVESVYRQLAEKDLLPEAWGGTLLTVNCSAVTGEGIKELLETLALQAEILELKANPNARARGTVIESEMHKGLGSVATVLVQNGTLRLGDALVFEQSWGRVKTMHDEFGKDILEATPSTPVAITGLSGLPEAGQEFIVVKNEREARDIGEARMQGVRQLAMQQKKKLTLENLLQQATPSVKKVLNVILRADVQGSLEALGTALMKIKSDKAEINILFAGVGEVAESDIQLAATSKATVIGFHTQIESHAEQLVKELGVQVRLHNIIYHAIDDIKVLMVGLLDKIAQETEKGKAEVKALFKSSHLGVIVGCIVTEGTIHRNNHIRIMRGGTSIGKTTISSLKRVKEDVREVVKGLECGIVLNKAPEIIVGDILEAYEITYITQEL